MSLIGRTLATALSFVIIAGGVAGCGNASDTNDSTKRVKIAFLLPDVQAMRYDRFDVPYFADKVEALCPNCEIIYRNAAQLTKTQQFQAEEALEDGAKVLVLDPVDGVAARQIVELAKKKGVPVIAYDRMVERADVDYYVSFDNENIGRLQATALVQRLNRAGIKTGKIVMINGADTDNNARLFNKGARSVFDKTGYQTVPKPDYFTPDWSPAKAKEFMSQQITKLRPIDDPAAPPDALGFVGVYVANDGMAGGAIAALRAAGVKQLPPVTGQDAELDAIQRVLAGSQYMTIHKEYRQEAERTAEFAVALARGQRPTATTKVNNGRRDVPAELVGALTITRENIQKEVLDTQLYTIGELCTPPFIAACAQLGLH